MLQNENHRMNYTAYCSHCSARFDALEAPWCQCLHKERSVICPKCNQCFCSATTRYKQAFWMHAPPAMWARKREEASRQTTFRNKPLDEVGRPLVLVVDDDKQIQQVAIGVILGEGFEVIVGNNGEEGLRLTAQYMPDLVLTDALMPKLDGREMTRKIKENWDTASVAVVIMTSLYTSGKYKSEAIKKFGADDYLAKPLHVDALRAVLHKFLG